MTQLRFSVNTEMQKVLNYLKELYPVFSDTEVIKLALSEIYLQKKQEREEKNMLLQKKAQEKELLSANETLKSFWKSSLKNKTPTQEEIDAHCF